MERLNLEIKREYSTFPIRRIRIIKVRRLYFKKLMNQIEFMLMKSIGQFLTLRGIGGAKW